MDAASELIKLAEKKFGKLTVAEKKLFRAAAKGEMADYSPRSKKPIDPAHAAKWGPSRVLLADRIAWLCTDKQALQLVAHRGIRITGARVDDELDISYGKIRFPLWFEQSRFMADINLRHAQIATLCMPGTHTGLILADGLKVAGSIFLRDGFRAKSEVRLRGAAVGGDLDCSKGQFINKDGDAFSADGSKVAGGVYFSDGFESHGEVRLLGAVIGGAVDCSDGHFLNKDRKAFSADRLKVDGSVSFCKGFKAEGEVRLRGATVGGNLVCEEGQFINQGGRAINADGMKVGESVFLRKGFEAKGLVSFVLATIPGHFCLADIDSPEDTAVDLRSAKIGTLNDRQESWPDSGRLSLYGLEYEEIFHESPRDSKTRIEWLRLQKGFWPQPYEQLAKVLRESGDGAGARDVLVAKNRDKAKLTKLTFPEKCWYHVLGRSIGYGHKPWVAVPLVLVIILFGSMFFKEGYSHGLVTPLSESAYAEDNTGAMTISEIYPVFNSLVYSIDVFVPVVDLHQAKYWLPNANRGSELVPTSSAALCTGGLLLFWLWFEIACGWVLTTLFLVGLTGLVRT